MPNSHPGYHQFELYCKRIMLDQLQWCRDPDGEASWYDTVVHVNLTLLATRGMLLAAVFNVLVSMLDSLANTSSTPPLRAKQEETITYASTWNSVFLLGSIFSMSEPMFHQSCTRTAAVKK